MSSSTVDRTILGSAFALFLGGLLAWWIAPQYDPTIASPTSPMTAIWLSAGGIGLGAWAVSRLHRPRESRAAAALTLAATASLSVVPLVSIGFIAYDPIMRLGLTLAAVAALPLCLSLCDWVSEERIARRIQVLTTLLVAGAVVAGFVNVDPPVPVRIFEDAVPQPSDESLRWLLLATAYGIAAATAIASVLHDARSISTGQARIITALGLSVAGIVPAVTGIALVTPTWQLFVVPLFAAAATALILLRVAIRPLADEAGSALAERDLVIAAAEAERRRLAAALHDGPLGDIALLVQRLDAAGDARDAAIARQIAGDLRAIGNDLNLPVLEDLGAGPALEWLVQRVSGRAGLEVRLELATAGRPPAPVELAVYRIAQEALANAVRHGAAPVLVRYASAPGVVTLSVDDHGPGLDAEAPRRAQRDGRLGLLLMSQRAQAIGAELVLAARASGGTHVALTWNAAT